MSEEAQVAEQQATEVTEVSKVEQRAKVHGWVPKDEFRGDPDKWVDAQTFVRRGDEEIPLLRERNRALERKQAQLEKTLKEFSEYITGTERRAYQRAYEELKQQQRQAVSEADPDKFDAAEKKMEALRQDITAMKPPKVEVNPKDDPTVQEWMEKNRWFTEDEEMQAIALSYNNYLFEKKKIGGKALLDAVEAHMKKLYPEKFGNAMRRQPGAVTSGGETAPRQSRGKGYADLPSEAKAACDRFVKAGLLTKDDYVKDYFSQG